MKRSLLGGYLITIAAGIMWGVSDSCGQYAFSHYPDFSAVWLTVLRMITAGFILCLFNFIRHRDAFIGIWKEKPDALQLIAFAICGLMLSQFTTFQAIRITNAGTATVLQALFPVLILFYTCITQKRGPKPLEVIAVCLAVFGTYLLSTHGNPKTMVLTPAGLLWGLASASTAALYTLISARIVKKWGSIIVTGFGLLVGGIFLALVTRIWTQPLSLGWDGWLAVAGTIVFGTLFAYTFYVAGCAKIGAVKGSLLALLEPVSATFLAVLWLGSSFGIFDFLGLVCILSVTFLLTRKGKETA